MCLKNRFDHALVDGCNTFDEGALCRIVYRIAAEKNNFSVGLLRLPCRHEYSLLSLLHRLSLNQVLLADLLLHVLIRRAHRPLLRLELLLEAIRAARWIRYVVRLLRGRLLDELLMRRLLLIRLLVLLRVVAVVVVRVRIASLLVKNFHLLLLLLLLVLKRLLHNLMRLACLIQFRRVELLQALLLLQVLIEAGELSA